jgi:hypothetical protein
MCVRAGYSAMSLWEVQLADGFEGGPVAWDKTATSSSGSPFPLSVPIRLRNVVTGLFLLWTQVHRRGLWASSWGCVALCGAVRRCAGPCREVSRCGS